MSHSHRSHERNGQYYPDPGGPMPPYQQFPSSPYPPPGGGFPPPGGMPMPFVTPPMGPPGMLGAPQRPGSNRPQPPAKEAPEKPEKTAPEAPVVRHLEHSKELIAAFRPIQYFLTMIGQMPFVIRPKKDGTYTFKFHKFSRAAFIYFFMFLISTFVYFTVTVGVLSFIAPSVFSYIEPNHTVIVKDKDYGTTEEMKWERYLVRHEMVSMIVVWSWQTVAFAGSIYIVTNSKYYVHYMNYFNRVVQIMDMDLTPGVGAYILFNNLLSFMVAVFLTLGFIVGFLTEFTAVKNTSTVISNFILRLFNHEIQYQEEGQIYIQVLGYLIMIYALFASRANVVQFLFFSQLLKNASKVWNERLRKALTHEKVENLAISDQFCRRLEPKLIYKDHLMIVQLYQMTENVFGSILFSYYSLTLISVVMELYQLAALQGFGADVSVISDPTEESESKDKLVENRKGVTSVLDRTQEREILAIAAVALLLLGQNAFFCYRTTVDAAKAYETAMNGFDILRRHGLMYCNNKTDRNFVLSLYFSFAKNNPLQLTAGGYFAVNKLLLVTMSSAVVNWAISIYQTKVDQWK